MSFEARIAEASLRAEQPVSALLELTYRCNWRCTFCFNPRRSDLSPLSTDKWLTLLPGLHEAGVLSLVLTGGEPLAHAGCLEIAGAAGRAGMMVTLFTNGSLIDKSVAESIAAARVFLVELSIHGARAETHEALTGASGSFEAVLDAVRLLKSAGIRVALKTTLTRLNEGEIDEMRANAVRLDVPFAVNPTVMPNDTGDMSPLRLRASDEALRRELTRAMRKGDLVPKERRDGAANCSLGRSTLRIDPEGNVYPCSRWLQPIGNLRENDLREIWQTPDRKRAAAVSDATNDAMAEASPLSTFPFCPAIAISSGSIATVPSPAQQRLIDLADEAWLEVADS